MEGADMQCSQCRFESFHGTKFCKKCGNKLEFLCLSRDHPDQIDSLFCDECDYNFKLAKETSGQISETEPHPFSPSENKPFNGVDPVTGERKQMTGIFSDFTGYTAISEKPAPEGKKDPQPVL